MKSTTILYVVVACLYLTPCYSRQGRNRGKQSLLANQQRSKGSDLKSLFELVKNWNSTQLEPIQKKLYDDVMEVLQKKGPADETYPTKPDLPSFPSPPNGTLEKNNSVALGPNSIAGASVGGTEWSHSNGSGSIGVNPPVPPEYLSVAFKDGNLESNDSRNISRSQDSANGVMSSTPPLVVGNREAINTSGESVHLQTSSFKTSPVNISLEESMGVRSNTSGGRSEDRKSVDPQNPIGTKLLNKLSEADTDTTKSILNLISKNPELIEQLTKLKLTFGTGSLGKSTDKEEAKIPVIESLTPTSARKSDEDSDPHFPVSGREVIDSLGEAPHRTVNLPENKIAFDGEIRHRRQGKGGDDSDEEAGRRRHRRSGVNNDEHVKGRRKLRGPRTRIHRDQNSVVFDRKISERKYETHKGVPHRIESHNPAREDRKVGMDSEVEGPYAYIAEEDSGMFAKYWKYIMISPLLCGVFGCWYIFFYANRLKAVDDIEMGAKSFSGGRAGSSHSDTGLFGEQDHSDREGFAAPKPTANVPSKIVIEPSPDDLIVDKNGSVRKALPTRKAAGMVLSKVPKDQKTKGRKTSGKRTESDKAVSEETWDHKPRDPTSDCDGWGAMNDSDFGDDEHSRANPI